MPELPEVETIKNILKTVFIGKKITKVDVLRKSTILGDVKDFIASVEGNTVKDISRIGKYLIFHFENDLVMLSHLRMEGKYYEFKESEQNSYFSRVVFHLNNGNKVCYDDSRCFGILKLTTEKKYKYEPEISKLGPEPFDIKDVTYLLENNKKSNHPIKSIITDQTQIAGIGNIYADEILFATKINPLTPGRLITKKQWEDIVKSAEEILNESIKQGGSTILSYHPGNNVDGKFQVLLKAYGKEGENCPICGTPFKFIKVNGRGTTYCPNCQEKQGAPIKIALIGKVASGKTTVLETFAQYGSEIVSCDEVISRLYNSREIANYIAKMFNLKFDKIVDKSLLRDYLKSNPKDVKKLTNFIYPKVIEEVKIAFKTSKKKLIVVEAPLLYEAKMEGMFDEIIAIDIDEDIQLKRLMERNPETGKFLKQLSDKNNSFEKNKKRANIVINNNGSISELIKTTKKIINKFLDRLD